MVGIAPGTSHHQHFLAAQTLAGQALIVPKEAPGREERESPRHAQGNSNSHSSSQCGQDSPLLLQVDCKLGLRPWSRAAATPNTIRPQYTKSRLFFHSKLFVVIHLLYNHLGQGSGVLCVGTSYSNSGLSMSEPSLKCLS